MTRDPVPAYEVWRQYTQPDGSIGEDRRWAGPLLQRRAEALVRDLQAQEDTLKDLQGQYGRYEYRMQPAGAIVVEPSTLEETVEPIAGFPVGGWQL